MKKEAVIISAARTPVGRMRGALAGVAATDLGALVMKAAVERAGILPEQIDDVIFGNLGNNQYANLARVAALKAGFPVSVPGFTIDRQCSSGLNAIALAAMMIESGHGEVFVAGGVESDSSRPNLLARPTQAYQLNPPEWLTRYTAPEGMNFSMGETAENLCDKYQITREQCDAFAQESHRRAARAAKDEVFQEQIVPVPVTDRKGNITEVTKDECIRPDTTMETLAGLKPVFRKDGRITAGTSSPMSDGAGAVVVMEKQRALKENKKIRAQFVDFAVTGCDPSIMGIGPVEAVRKLLKQNGLTLQDIDLIELNEAFASQSLACIQELGLDTDKVNVNGGALALGHPLAGTGGILTTKLIYEMEARRAGYGIVSFCMAGGQGAAALLKRI
ncbi:Acetyl-CoA acetyltransferase [uncultured Roseburia sp.]|uniref:Thiolase family protein n=1 Tax=Brotonthovivens ammoniilytica TaxID=2981725 RepID=A0ABT2TFX9_9FIRM|nr:thiolase family protein [Brotonthovivens ammoniilytica]MCU6761094.1 thiolase family protein [Brotonthovivens ammoniilytica]SCI18657.1 Acetyl-CoA acetyltransferase [uncultured Roseburia sp.]